MVIFTYPILARDMQKIHHPKGWNPQEDVKQQLGMGNWEPLKHPLKPVCGRPISSHETMGHGRTTYNFTWTDTFCYLFGFSLPAIGNFRDRRGRSLAYHGEPLDMLLWRRMLHQIERLKHSGKNPIPPNHQFPVLHILYHSALSWFQHISKLACFKMFHRFS